MEPEAPPYAGRVHPLGQAEVDAGRFLFRPPTVLPTDAPGLARIYRRPGLDEINLGFAGRRRPRHPVHRAIAALSPGDPLELRGDRQGRRNLLDDSGTIVGRLGGKFMPPPGMRCTSATVVAVVAWSREASDPRYRDDLKCDTWEVVIPELVFEPAD